MLFMDPRMFLALHRPKFERPGYEVSLRCHMWKLFHEHMKFLVTLKLVCKDMNSQTVLDISILGGDCALDLNSRMAGLRLAMSMISDVIVPDVPFADHADASERVFVS